ncbi:hypothetical protein HH214_11465 [Mucilaginibacter robiniae]|uniref:YncE family protein n=1 Tax=Mucilaginibacter robiniae TaxID=2728022 RepID=A0A7L5DZN3_9SPHI|nr:DUF5074 domain-containing protein [Mucilaginibacter robiniae]QJD96445.1 hypothetical protein HH214_11465 [Mucilaginibacter robiniae]
MKTNLPLTKSALVLLLSVAVLFSACKKDHADHPPVINGTAGVYVLCEGSYGKANSAITYYDINTNTATADIFQKVNNAALGESANDLQQYGSKMYCVVSGIKGNQQSFVDVLDLKTCKLIKQISFNATTGGALPRRIAFYQGKAYISRYDGKVSRLDTATLAVDGEVTLSEGLEGLAVANGKLYVANSANFQYTNGKGNVISVVDLNTFTKTKDIKVSYNPISVAAASSGDVYNVAAGDYYTIPAALTRISSAADTLVKTYTTYSNYSLLSISGTAGYVLTEPYSNPVIRTLNVSNGTLGSSNFITDGTKITTIYSLTINPFQNDVVITDANSYSATAGKVYYFSADGKIKYSFASASFPQRAVFVYKYE